MFILVLVQLMLIRFAEQPLVATCKYNLQFQSLFKEKL